MDYSVAIAAYLTLFGIVGFLFLFVALLLGKLLRPAKPSAEKLATYECGEPSVGSSFVQFDWRFYVIALLFIIFEVEVAFFYPWAVVFGGATRIADDRAPVVEMDDREQLQWTETTLQTWDRMGVEPPRIPIENNPDQPTTLEQANNKVRGNLRELIWLSVADIGVFFLVLMVGFAYVWRRGDLDWIRPVLHGDGGPDEDDPDE